MSVVPLRPYVEATYLQRVNRTAQPKTRLPTEHETTYRTRDYLRRDCISGAPASGTGVRMRRLRCFRFAKELR